MSIEYGESPAAESAKNLGVAPHLWAAAIQAAAERRREIRSARSGLHDKFYERWCKWTYESGGDRFHVPLPANWSAHVDRFLEDGLEIEELIELIGVSMDGPAKIGDGKERFGKWFYFCGCARHRRDDLHEMAKQILEQSSEKGSAL